MTSRKLLYGGIFSGLEAYSILRKAFLSKIQHRDIVFFGFSRLRQTFDLLMILGVIDPTEFEYDP